MDRQINIIGGPDKFNMAIALLDGNQKEQRALLFELSETGSTQHTWTENIKVDSIEREDGSGNCWNIKGYNRANQCKVIIFYQSQKGTGHIIFKQ